MKTFKASNFLKGLFSILFVALLFSACKKDNIVPVNPDGDFSLGLTSDDDPSKIPSAINLSIGNTNLPSKYDLSDKFPPIGNQGQYGTCVAWAVGYNTKTALNALDHNLSSSQLANKTNQTSPAYLWMSIPGSDKGNGCDGTSFEPALEALIKNGAVSEQVFPYTSKLSCDQMVDGSMATDAAKNKLENFRKIDISVVSIKTYISENRPVILGAILSSNFQPWNSDAVLSSHSNEPASQHGRHAMVIVGYDDSKGPNGAFRLINSWDDNWGDNGFIWVDYNFLVKPEFGFLAFVATNTKGDVNPDVDPDPTNGNFDLIPWNVYDEVNQNGGNSRERTAYYNIYNIGQQTVRASAKWNMCYIYYNAFNANDYGIILYDSYTNEFGSIGDNGPLQSGPGFSGNWWNNIDIPSGSGMAEELFDDSYVTWNYTMPNITGYYYLVAIADAYNAVDEIDEANNFFYLGNEYGEPVYIQNGIVQGLQDNNPATRKKAAPTAGAKLDSPRQMSKANYNAYTPTEISNMLLDHKKSGKLQNKIVAHQAAKAKRSK
jgi:hypothetical protein